MSKGVMETEKRGVRQSRKCYNEQPKHPNLNMKRSKMDGENRRKKHSTTQRLTHTHTTHTRTHTGHSPCG